MSLHSFNCKLTIDSPVQQTEKLLFLNFAEKIDLEDYFFHYCRFFVVNLQIRDKRVSKSKMKCEEGVTLISV